MINMKGVFECTITSPSGEVAFEAHNDVTDQGLDYASKSALLNGPVPSAVWCVGLIDGLNFSGAAVTDTGASHPGWQEFKDYGDRQLWTRGAVADATLSSTDAVAFTATSAGTIKGLFLTISTTGSIAIVWNTAIFDEEQTLAIGSVLEVKYTIQIQRGN